MHRRFLSLVALGLAAFGAMYVTVKLSQSPTSQPADAPPGMVCIRGGEFTMGTDDPNSMSNERPAVRMSLAGFWMDQRDVTNAEFRKFVNATSYVTTAEKPINWEEMKLTVPPGTPKPRTKSCNLVRWCILHRDMPWTCGHCRIGGRGPPVLTGNIPRGRPATLKA